MNPHGLGLNDDYCAELFTEATRRIKAGDYAPHATIDEMIRDEFIEIEGRIRKWMAKHQKGDAK